MNDRNRFPKPLDPYEVLKVFGLVISHSHSPNKKHVYLSLECSDNWGRRMEETPSDLSTGIFRSNDIVKFNLFLTVVGS
jgi:hypothetical protein